jgi:hypothetical protein
MKVLITTYLPFELWRAPSWFSGRLCHEFPGFEFVQRQEYGSIEDGRRIVEVI